MRSQHQSFAGLSALTVIVVVAGATQNSNAPLTLLWDPNTIESVRAGVAGKNLSCLAAPAQSLASRAAAAAENYKQYGPWSVMNKKSTPPSGSKHDYMSLDKYYWPCNAPPPLPPTTTTAATTTTSTRRPRPSALLMVDDTSSSSSQPHDSPSWPSVPDPLCKHGIEHHSDEQPSTCCLASCGACGGHGCADWPGGNSGCCTDGVIDTNRSCDKVSAPCVLDENPCDNKTGLPWYNHDGYVHGFVR